MCRRCYLRKPLPAQMAPSVIIRVNALCSWLQAGGIASSESELNSWREECKALALLLSLEDEVLENMGTSIHRVTFPSRLRAMLSLLTGCILSSDAAPKLSYDAVSSIHSKAVLWVCSFLDIEPERDGPSSSQLAVAEVLLRAKVLQGCSRLLASATAAVITSGGGTQHAGRRSQASGPPLQQRLAATAVGGRHVRVSCGTRSRGGRRSRRTGCRAKRLVPAE